MVFTNVVNPRSHVPRKDEFRRTTVRRGASLGANCTIVCGHDIGAYAFVGAGAVVTRDIPDFGLVLGNPARVAGWVCMCGVTLSKTATPPVAIECPSCGESYRSDGARLVRTLSQRDRP
jgi:UDP-2-acetamido-3-amino-2,3-dideoxy-glucuronate N-acetyltransferase